MLKLNYKLKIQNYENNQGNVCGEKTKSHVGEMQIEQFIDSSDKFRLEFRKYKGFYEDNTKRRTINTKWSDERKRLHYGKIKSTGGRRRRTARSNYLYVVFSRPETKTTKRIMEIHFEI